MRYARAIGLVLALGLFGAAIGIAQNEGAKKPLSEADLLKLVKADLEDEVIIALIKKRGVDFKADDEALARLKKGGASPAVLAALQPQEGGDAGTDKVLATAKHDKGLSVEVLEVKPDANKPLLTVRWRYRNPTKRTIELIGPSPKFIGTSGRPSDRFLNGVYYLEGNKQDEEIYRCSIAKDTGGKWWCTEVPAEGVQVKAGEAVEFWAKFSPPEASTRKISLHLPETPPIEDLPVQKKAEK
jgi:hypothetical protein